MNCNREKQISHLISLHVFFSFQFEWQKLRFCFVNNLNSKTMSLHISFYHLPAEPIVYQKVLAFYVNLFIHISYIHNFSDSLLCEWILVTSALVIGIARESAIKKRGKLSFAVKYIPCTAHVTCFVGAPNRPSRNHWQNCLYKTKRFCQLPV